MVGGGLNIPEKTDSKSVTCNITSRNNDRFSVFHSNLVKDCMLDQNTFFNSLVIYHSMQIYLFGVLCRFQHCTGHITTGSWKGRGNQYIQLVKVLYHKLLTNGKQLPAFPLEAVPGT